MRNSTCIDSASLNKGPPPKGTTLKIKERMIWYKKFAVAFSYPEGDFFIFFPEQKKVKAGLPLEYDCLFRSFEVWLYGAEYVIENEFQRVQTLADISGFYKAFGLEAELNRPDALSCELEFMHYLVFREMNAPDKEKVRTCFSAEKKFFLQHLYPQAKKFAEKLRLHTRNKFYLEISECLSNFLESERKIYR